MSPLTAVTVVGEGTVRVTPDIAHATLGVEVVDATARTASQTDDLAWSAWTREVEGVTWVATFSLVRQAEAPDQVQASLRAVRQS